MMINPGDTVDVTLKVKLHGPAFLGSTTNDVVLVFEALDGTEYTVRGPAKMFEAMIEKELAP